MLPARYLAVCSFGLTGEGESVRSMPVSSWKKKHMNWEKVPAVLSWEDLPLNMIIIEEKLVSEDILDVEFACNLTACKEPAAWKEMKGPYWKSRKQIY